MSSGRLVRTRAAAVLAVIGVVLIATGLASPSGQPPIAAPAGSVDVPGTRAPGSPATATPTPASPRAERHPAPTRVSDVDDSVTGPVLPESAPVAVSIPRIGVRSTLVRLGLEDDRAMEVPRDPARAGWFTRGAAPGALGPAVIAGHVTWNGTPGVFYRLDTLRRGDRIAVTREDGSTAVFAVDTVARYQKTRFPVRTVYGPIDHAGLRLVTCGGPYDSSRHRYPDNVVVFAHLASVRR